MGFHWNIDYYCDSDLIYTSNSVISVISSNSLVGYIIWLYIETVLFVKTKSSILFSLICDSIISLVTYNSVLDWQVSERVYIQSLRRTFGTEWLRNFTPNECTLIPANNKIIRA